MEAAIGYPPARPARTASPGTGGAPPTARKASPGDGGALATARAASPGISAVLDVLDVLDRQGPATLAQLARETGTAKSTLHRVCTMMSERGWVARDPRSGYMELGPRVAWLARSAPLSPLTAGFHGVARRLVGRHNETTCLTVLDGRESVFIAKEETTHAVRLVTAVGSRLPAFAAASGRAMLAYRSEEEVAALHEGCELVTPTGRRLERPGGAVRDPARGAPARLRREHRRDLARAALPGGAGGAAGRGRDHAVRTVRADERRPKREMLPPPTRGARIVPHPENGVAEENGAAAARAAAGGRVGAGDRVGAGGRVGAGDRVGAGGRVGAGDRAAISTCAGAGKHPSNGQPRASGQSQANGNPARWRLGHAHQYFTKSIK